MRKVNRFGTRVLEELTRGLKNPFEDDSASARKVDAGGAFMPVCVERIAPHLYSVAHYRELNGDLLTDPEMVFLKTEGGRWFPISFEMGGQVYEVSVDQVNGEVRGFYQKMQAKHASFANDWLQAINRQQSLLDPPRVEA